MMKASGGKNTRLVVDRSVKGDDGFTDDERDKRVQEVSCETLLTLTHQALPQC
jgi:hypothetical protein